jgi:hypothetical protein
MPDFNRSRLVWHGHIARWGGGVDNGQIDRGGTLRTVTIAMNEYKPSERGLYVDGAVRFAISALKTVDGKLVQIPADEVPDPELDEIVFAGKRYKILMVPQNPMPDGTWIAFDLPGVFTGAA